MWHVSVCNTVQEPTVTSTTDVKKTTTWGESGFPSEFLDRLDKYVEAVLIPAHTRGTRRRRNPAWNALRSRMVYHGKMGHHRLATELRQQMQQLSSGDPHDPDYRRLRYVRYAADFVLGFIGPKAEAEQIKESLATFLCESLKLELSGEKTLITHATSQAARFLGYELVNQQANDQHDPSGRRAVNGKIGLRVPAKVIEQHCHAYMSNGKPVRRTGFHNDEDYTIVSRYQAEFRGVVQYYLLAYNVSHFGRLQWVMGKSLAKTLASKHKTTSAIIFRRYTSTVQTAHGERACLEVEVQRGNGKPPLVTRFGGIPLKRKRQAVLADQKPQRYRTERNELIKRLLVLQRRISKCDVWPFVFGHERAIAVGSWQYVVRFKLVTKTTLSDKLSL